MLSNAYFIAKIRFHTAENEPAKNLQNFRKIHFSKNSFFETGRCSQDHDGDEDEEGRARREDEEQAPTEKETGAPADQEAAGG